MKEKKKVCYKNTPIPDANMAANRDLGHKQSNAWPSTGLLSQVN